MDIQKLIQSATQKGLSAIDSIRSSITPQNIPNPVSSPIRQPLNQLRSEIPQTPVQTPVQSRVTDGFKPFGEFKVPVKAIEMKPETAKLINIKPETQRLIDQYQMPVMQRQAKVLLSAPERVRNTFNAVIELNPLYKVPEAIASGDISKLKPDTNKILAGLDTFNLFNDLYIQPFYDSAKLNYAEAKGQKFDLATKQSILKGEQPIFLNDILGNTEQNTKPITYNLIRFADFAPALIDLPLGQVGKTQQFAKQFKVLDETGKFAPKLEKIVAEKLAQFEQTIGRKLTPEETTVIRKNIAKPTDIENAIKQVNVAKVAEAVPFDTSKYVQSLVAKQKEAKIAGKPSFFDGLKKISNEIDVKFQDFTTPINQAVNNAIKRGEKIAPTENPIFQIDKVLRSDSLASQFVKDNKFAQIVQKTDNLDEFNQYLIAKSTQELKKLKPNIKTGRNAVEDAKLIKDLDPKYSKLADEVFAYNKKVLQAARDYGLISEDLYKTLSETRSQYVPINRIFSDIEEVGGVGRPREVASLKRQNLVKRLKGSEREIANPLESMLTNTYKLVSQGERNIAARQIASLVERKIIPGKILKKGTKYDADEVISYLDNGERKNVFVGKEIARAAKNLNKEASNFLVNILRVPTRILQVGAVGLNLPFIVSNIIRDQQTAAIVTGKPLRTTILNPINFVKAIYEAGGEGKVYDDFIRAGAGYSSLDITRDTAKTIQQLKDEASPFVKGAKTITNPAELFKAVEDVISKGETATRIQVYKTTYDDLIKRGESVANAEILAADAARNVTANFARRGEYGTVLNAVIPFFNATVQGARTLRNSFVKNPVKTTALFAATVGVPTAISTLWNIQTPERKKAYDMIPEYEKERNLIILPPEVTYDEKGYPFYFRLPKAQGYSQLANPIRVLLEKSYESNADAAVKITNDILSANFGVNLPITEESRRQLTAQYTPQILKPAIESQTGVNLYTGQKIIPMGLEKLPPQEQVKETTSFTARKVGGYLNVSPLLVENTLKTSLGGLGEQILNLSDRYYATTGQAPEQQIGGRDPFQSILNVFYRASGGADVQKIYDQLQTIDTEKALLNLKVKQLILNNDTEGLKALTPNLTKQQFTSLENSVSENEFAKTLSPQNRALFNSTNTQLESLRQASPNLSADIDNILQLKQQLKEKQKIDTDGFEFKPTTIAAAKVKTKKTAGKRLPRPKKLAFGKIKKPRILKPKPFKKIKFKTAKTITKKLRPKNIA